MKKSLPIRWLGLPFLFVMLLLGNSQKTLANNPLNCACIGNDTLICDFTSLLIPPTAGGEWSVLCDSTDGSVDFDIIDATTTQITVSECGDYHLIYTVDDGMCMSADTAVFTFGDPSFGYVDVTSGGTLEYDGTVFCHQSPPPSSCNPVSMGGGPPPTVSWNVCGQATGSATIFSTDVMGDMPAVCLADEITVSSESFSDFSDLGCMNYTEDEFLANFFSILAGSGSGTLDSLDIPFGDACSIMGQIDTIYNDSIYFDTITYLIPYRVGGQWNYIMDDGTLSPLNDTTNIVVNDSSLIFIVDPGSDYYGPNDLEFTVFVENDMMEWVNPDFDIEMEIQWVEEFAYDTLTQIFESDSITIVTQNCGGFGFSNDFSISGPPTYPCGPVTLNFNFATPPDPLIATIAAVWDDICGYCDGGAFLDVQGGCPPYSQTEFYGLCAGGYTFTVTDANGNESPPVAVFVNEEPPPFIANVEVINDECEEDNGSLTIDAFGGLPPYTYFVNGQSSGNPTFSGLAAGSYSIEIIDNNGCSDFSSATITTTPAASVSISGNLTICPGEQTTLVADGNFDTAEWTPGGSGNSITVGAGTYCVLVTTADGCTAEECVSVSELNNLPVDISGDLEVCLGEQTTLTANGGFSSYAWDNGSSDASIIVGEGTYCVTVTNNSGCTGEACVTVTESIPPLVDIFGDTEICEGSTGVLTANTNTNGAIQWDNGDIGMSITVTTGGIYCVTVFDNNGCDSQNCIAVTENPNPTPTITGNTQIPAGTTTTLSTGNFDAYQWDNGETTASIDVGIGTYCVIVTDENGCTGETCTTVTESGPNLSPNITGDVEFCENTSTTLTVNGNFATYIWSNGATDATITVTEGGAYSVTVSDGMGNTAATSEVVNELPAPTPTIDGDAFICEGEMTQLATQNYLSYQWSNGSTDATTSVASTNVYEVIVEGNNGCFGSALFNVEAVPLPSASAFSSGDIDCINELVVLDGSNSNGSNLSYNWSTSDGNIIGNTNDLMINADAAGIYTLTVVESLNDCESITSISVLENITPPFVEIANATAIDCLTPMATIDGGNSDSGNGFEIAWLDENGATIAGENQPILTTTTAGNYTLQITNSANGCVETAMAIVEDISDIPDIAASVSNEINCVNLSAFLSGEGSATGSNIVYQWQNSQGIWESDNLNYATNAGGTYSLIVTNLDNNCVATQAVVVDENTQAPELFLNSNQTLPCEGAMEILPTNTPPNTYTYDWTNADGNPIADATTATPSVEIAGTYSVIITDSSNGCTNTTATEILANETTPQGVDLALQTPTCFGDADGQIMVESVIDGNGPFLFSIDGNTFSDNMIFDNLPAGSFELIVESQASGCVYTEMVTLDDGDLVNLELGEDLTINLGETIEVGAQFPVDESIIDNVVWTTAAQITCDTCLTNPVLLMENTTFDLTVTTENGCVVSDQIQILVQDNTETFAPNVFSPNNDGMNDRFTIYSNNDLLTIKTLAVYDRWGSLVFENNNFAPNDENLGWDGTFNGKAARQGVYIYMAEVVYLDGRKDVMKGDILVVSD